MVDDFDVEAPNKNLDRTCLVDELSGGQFVLVNKAVNLGIAIYNMRQGDDIRYETLFWDETAGALDAVNGKEYVRMLRRAMDLGGIHDVILSATRHLFGSWRTESFWPVADACLWGMTSDHRTPISLVPTSHSPFLSAPASVTACLFDIGRKLDRKAG